MTSIAATGTTLRMATTADSPAAPVPADGRQFASTRWTLVLGARAADAAQAEVALATLCRLYWPPLYAFARRMGRTPHDAQDLTQEFFARLLARDWLARADPARGRFRSFLLTAFKRFLAHEHERAQAARRGGGQVPVTLDPELAERGYQASLTTADTPERLYERRWAVTLLEQVLDEVRADLAAAGQAAVWDVLKDCLIAAPDALSYAELGQRLGLAEGAARVAVHRLRKRFRVLLRAAIADTVSAPDEVEDELRHLFAVLGG